MQWSVISSPHDIMDIIQAMHNYFSIYRSDQIRSVTQSCPTLCDPMNRSTPGLPVHHQLPEFTQSQWCHPAISSSVVPFSSCPQSLPASESFLHMSQLFAWGGQSTGVYTIFSPRLCLWEKNPNKSFTFYNFISKNPVNLLLYIQLACRKKKCQSHALLFFFPTKERKVKQAINRWSKYSKS